MENQHSKATAKTFDIVLWNEDTSQDFARNALANTPFTIAYCEHNKDTNEDGTPKKPHIHYVYKIPTKRSIGAIAKELQINPCYINTVGKEQEALLYLIHRGWNEKYQYDPNEVKGKGYLFERFHILVNDESEDDRVLKILNLIENYKGYLTMADLLHLCCERGIYTELRRGSSLFVTVLKEHNKYYEH